MNDLDLRSALHRDADLVGEPSPDLLEQLYQRRTHQRRQRAGLLLTVLAVVVIGAGIPVGTSLLARSDGGPATQSTSPSFEPTPSAAETTPRATPEITPEPTAEITPEPTAATSGDWPPEAEAVHGGQYWAVYLEVARPGTEQEQLQQAYTSASALGYSAGMGQMCEAGAAEQLGLDPTISYDAVSIFFATREQAQQFVDLYEPGVVGTAFVTAYCLD